MAKKKIKKSRKKKTKKKIIKKSKQKITKNMKFSELLSKYPQSAQVMLKYGLHCVGCHAASFETIQQGAQAHGMSKAQLSKMLNEMNKNINKKYKIEKTIAKTIKPKIEIKPKKKNFLKKIIRG